jgi:aminoglycoside phosphotransferase (APT) family kinase protein
MASSEHRQRLEALAWRIDPQGTLLRTWELKGGVSAQVTAFEVERDDGRRETLIVRRHGAADLRRNPQTAEDEFRLLQLLESAGVPAPTPRYLDEKAEIFSTPSLVVHYVEGELPPAAADREELVRQLAAMLAQIHRIDRSTADLSFLRDLAAIPPEGPADDQRVRSVLEAALPLPRRNRPVLLHGDFWPGNTIWRDGRLVAVVDWEDAAVGDPLADVANARLELLWALGIEAMDDFTRRYRALAGATDFTDLPYWDLWADLRLGGHIAKWGLDDVTEKRMRAGREAFVAQALEELSAR